MSLRPERRRASGSSRALLALVALGGCGPSTVVELAPPLSVVDTYPGNGTRLPGAEVTHLEVVFSEAVEGGAALEALKLEAVTSSDDVEARYALLADTDRAEDGFDDELLTLSTRIGEPSLDGALPDDARFRLTISAGLTARSGSVLPVDVIRRFTTEGP